MMDAAVAAGVDAYLTGEASEPTFQLAQETGTAFIGAGHHAAERYGVQALGQAIANGFGVKVDFVAINNLIGSGDYFFSRSRVLARKGKTSTRRRSRRERGG